VQISIPFFRDHLSQREPCNWGIKLVADLGSQFGVFGG
jgi:hypothetical protein